VSRISRDLLLDDLDLHRPRLLADVAPDFGEALYAAAVWIGGGTENVAPRSGDVA
jgi:hypothetical protein